MNSVKSVATASIFGAGCTLISIANPTKIDAGFELSGSFAGFPMVSTPYPAGV